MMKRYGVGAFGVVVGSLVAGACSSEKVVTPADAGGTDSGSDVYVPPGCNTPDEPSKNTASCLVDAYGIFLKPTGNDVTGTGTKDNPLRTLGAAATKLKGKAGRIVACAGSYEGAGTEITSAISIYGGFSCADWTYAATNETVFTTDAQKADVVLTLRSVTGVNVQDATFRARPGAIGGGSSIAVFVASSQAVKFLRAKLEADVGGDATNGTTQTMTLPDATALQGNAGDPGPTGAATDDKGGTAKAINCGGGKTSVGGKGGDFGLQGDNGQPATIGGAKGQIAVCGSGGTGGDGMPGAVGSGGSSPTSTGALSGQGWKPEGGKAGMPGDPGGGGGGGYGTNGGGGGGGAGGCGGGPGTGGTAGGSSIALASLDSEVTITDSSLTSKTAKRGGDGATGQTTRDEDVGPAGTKTGLACNGGNGGKGGAGGAGSGGAGGISVGVVYTKRKPTTERTQVAFGTLGAAGGGPGNPGVGGAAQDFLEVPGS